MVVLHDFSGAGLQVWNQTISHSGCHVPHRSRHLTACDGAGTADEQEAHGACDLLQVA